MLAYEEQHWDLKCSFQLNGKRISEVHHFFAAYKSPVLASAYRQ